jgi:hypothetical protein
MISAFFFTWFAATLIWTINALRRPVIPGHGVPPMWLPGMLVSELAPWYLVGRVVIAVLFIWAGALDLGIGQAGMALFIFSEVGLLVLIQRSFTAVADAGGKVAWRNILPMPARPPAGVLVSTDVPYWDDHTTDIYHRKTGEPAPALIYLHPGSWMR